MCPSVNCFICFCLSLCLCVGCHLIKRHGTDTVIQSPLCVLCLFLCLSVCLSPCLCLCLFAYLSAYLFVNLLVCFCLSLCLCVGHHLIKRHGTDTATQCPSLCALCLFLFPSVCLFIHLSRSLSVRLPTYLSVC